MIHSLLLLCGLCEGLFDSLTVPAENLVALWHRPYSMPY
jgi:hypothetical protein